MTKQKYQYLQYLGSQHWRELRAKVFERDGYKCLKCGTPHNLRGHHRRYRSNLELCTEADIETLCEKCHNHHHKQMNRERTRRRRALRKERKAMDPIAWLVCQFTAEDAMKPNL